MGKQSGYWQKMAFVNLKNYHLQKSTNKIFQTFYSISHVSGIDAVKHSLFVFSPEKRSIVKSAEIDVSLTKNNVCHVTLTKSQVVTIFDRSAFWITISIYIFGFVFMFQNISSIIKQSECILHFLMEK